MAWSDEPTANQIYALFRLWGIPRDIEKDAYRWIEQRATRKEVSDELHRVRNHYMKRTLNNQTFFDSPIWEGFYYKEQVDAKHKRTINDVMRRVKARNNKEEQSWQEQ